MIPCMIDWLINWVGGWVSEWVSQSVSGRQRTHRRTTSHHSVISAKIINLICSVALNLRNKRTCVLLCVPDHPWRVFFCIRPRQNHAFSDISWSVVNNAKTEIRLTASVRFATINLLNSIKCRMGINQTWRVILIIFFSTASIHNARLFDICDIHSPFLGEVHGIPPSCFVPSSCLVYTGGETIAQCHQCHPRSFT